MENISKDVLNLVNLTPSDIQDVHWREENNITAAEVFLDVDTLRAGKAASCDPIVNAQSREERSFTTFV